jgi:hypothetical protein
MALWCIFNYERRAPVHYFLIVFAFLIAIHWFDYLSGQLNWLSPLYNTVPFIVLAFMAIGMKSVQGAKNDRFPSDQK